MDSGYTHTGINKQLVKEERIKTKPIDRSFEVFNIDGIKNREVTQFAPLEVEINRYKKKIDTIVTDLNVMDIKIVDGGLCFYFPFFFYLIFAVFLFFFLFLEQLGLGFVSHAVTSVTS